MNESVTRDPTVEPAGPATLLVGTSRSVAELAHLLQVASEKPRIVGCVVPRRVQGPASIDQPISPSVAVLGSLPELEQVLRQWEIEQVLVSLPVAMGLQARRVCQSLQRMGLSWRILPTLSDQLAGRCRSVFADLQAAGPAGTGSTAIAGLVDPLQLIGRQPRPLDEKAITRVLAGRVVMITGAGGSIGSELARLVARFNPAKLVLVERSENALFEIDRQIATLFPQLQRAAVLHDVSNVAGTLTMVSAQQPQVIFHAAAHKHVPMMESHPAEAIENNFYGTRSIADAAAHVRCERFVMISTDKAVKPSSVMGASKRLAELYVQHLNEKHAAAGTRFCMVRFGNVLGSACSVMPIWTQQLAQGMPVSVTHPQMTRYFMTIPEAAGLVLQSAAFTGMNSSEGGEVFVLDMGEPVNILELARRFIRSQGLEPDIDVPIAITGIRPGEKLAEELAYDSEDMLPTPHPSIHILGTQAVSTIEISRVIENFDRLRARPRQDGNHWELATRDDILAALHEAIPEMTAAATDVPIVRAAG